MLQSNNSDHSVRSSILSLHVGNSKDYNAHFLALLKENLVHLKRHSLDSYRNNTESPTLRKYYSQPGVNLTSFESIKLPNLNDSQSPRSTHLLTTVGFNAQKTHAQDECLILTPGLHDVIPSKISGTKNKICGALKENLGKVFCRPRLEASGFSEKMEGEVRIDAAKHVKVIHFKQIFY